MHKMVNAKIKPGLVGLSLGLNAPRFLSSIASHHHRRSHLGCRGDLEEENGNFGGPEQAGEAKPRLTTKPDGWESREPMHGCSHCPGSQQSLAAHAEFGSPWPEHEGCGKNQCQNFGGQAEEK